MSCQQQKNLPAVLITGAARRIGAVIAETLARAGWRVLIHANRSRAEATALAQRLCADGLAAGALGGDLATDEGPQSVFAAALALTAGNLSAIVNNAAVFERPAPGYSPGKGAPQDPQSLRLLRINYDVPTLLTRRLAEHLAARAERGCVVNLLDQRITNLADQSPYTGSKRKLAEFTLREARSFAPVLRLTGVAPGAILAPVSRAAREPAGDFPLGFRPTPAHVARAVRFLLEADSVTGQIIYVDSGQHLQ